MSIIYNTFDGGTNGTAMTTANTGGTSGTAFTAVVSDATFSTEQAHSGTLSMKMGAQNAAVAAYGRWTDTTPAANVQEKQYFFFTTAHTTDYGLFETRGDTSSGSRKASVLISGANKLRVNISGNATPIVFTSTADFPLNQWVRVEGMFETGTSDSTGRVRVAMYLGDSSTPVEDTGWLTGLNMRYSLNATQSVYYAGKSGTSAYNGLAYMDTVRIRSGAEYTGAFIGPETVTLPTPVVTLGTTTNPSTIGGTNGSQVVTWPAVSGATSYVAYIANGSSPAQGDFTQVAAGVTSPYTFTGLAAGTYSFGIRAKA